MRHTKVIGQRHAAPLLPFSFSPGDWNKGSIQPPSALTKHSHFKDLSILNSNRSNLSFSQRFDDFLAELRQIVRYPPGDDIAVSYSRHILETAAGIDQVVADSLI